MKEREIHKLIADSGGRCNFPSCGEKLIFQYEDGTFVKLVEFCHIIGESPRGPRGLPTKSELMTQNPENIILLCVKHHKIVDNNDREYPIERLKRMKENHIQWVNERLDGLKEASWTLLIHSGNITGKGAPEIDLELIFQEFYGTHIFAEIEKIYLKEFLVETRNWLKYKKEQEKWWQDFLNQEDKPKKFVICSINFIPLVIHLGYLIHDTFITEIYQFHREENSWKWKFFEENEINQEFYLIDIDKKEDLIIKKIALSISISGNIKDDDIYTTIGEKINIIKLRVQNPSRNWLKCKEQFIEFQRIFINLIDSLIIQYKNLQEIHLFYAGPTPIAFIIGSLINPNMHPKFILYNYHLKSIPKYTKALEIN